MSQSYRKARALEAERTIKAGLDAAKRAAQIMASESKAVDAVVGMPISEQLDQIMGAHEGAADIIRKAADGAMAPAKPATARAATKALKGREIACKYALETNVTGALIKPGQRARNDARTQERVRAAIAYSDAAAAGLSKSREQACRDVVSHIHSMNRAKGGAQRKHCVSQIRAILHAWGYDAAVQSAAREAGWRV